MTRFVCLLIVDTDVTGKNEQEDAGGEEKEAEAENDAPKQTAGKTSSPTGFTVLGGFENKPVQKVYWLVNGYGRGSGYSYHRNESCILFFTGPQSPASMARSA